MEREDVIRRQLLALLRKGNAHMTLEEVVEDFPPERINDTAPHMPYSPWHILEHIRRAQLDIIKFIQEPDYVSPEWPKEYFPSPGEKTDAAGWRKTVADILADREVLEKMAGDLATDLFTPIPHATDYTIFRQILLAADHNAYHIGELSMMRQVMQAWPADKPLYDAK